MSGKLFKNKCTPIQTKLAPIVQQYIIDILHSIYPKLVCLPIGSVGKKNIDDYNSDIDIAIQCKDIETLQKIISSVFETDSIITIESLYIVSIAYPYKFADEPTKYVQCDFILMWDKAYTAFRYYCPNYINNESKYKVGAKIMFANMILNHTKEKNENLDKDYYIGQFDFRPTALYKFIFDTKNVKYLEEFITTNPIDIAKICFKDGDTKHFNSVETLWDAIHSNIFKYPDEVKSIEKNWFVNCWRKGWTSIVPEDFKLSYWTNEEIWKYINKQKQINTINQMFNPHEK